VALLGPGGEVFYAGSLERPGSHAAQQLVDERLVGSKLAALTHAQAAALPLTSLTALDAPFDKLGPSTASDGTLLMLGGAGRVGLMVIQLARALTGVRVIAAASRAESREWVTGLGADVVIDHSAPHFAEEILATAPRVSMPCSARTAVVGSCWSPRPGRATRVLAPIDADQLRRAGASGARRTQPRLIRPGWSPDGDRPGKLVRCPRPSGRGHRGVWRGLLWPLLLA